MAHRTLIDRRFRWAIGASDLVVAAVLTVLSWSRFEASIKSATPR